MDSSNEGGSPDRSAPPPDSDHPGRTERPDWLMGADEIMASEADLRSAADAHAETRRPAPPPPAMSDDSPGGEATRGADSRTPIPAPEPPEPPTLVSKIDLDDFRVDAEAAAAPDPPPAATIEPDVPWVDEIVAPEPRTREPGQASGVAAARRAPPKPAPPSFWSRATKVLATDRRIHVALAVVAVVMMIVSFTRNQLSYTRVAHIRRDPVKFDGKPVKLRGTVAEVFAVGSSYTYYLLDGRDTIVVFTRSQPPQPHQRVTVEGSVSTGYLEGVPRAAVFQQEAP